MASRMERYYQDKKEVPVRSRSKKNQNLYAKIYENAEYTNIETVVTTPKADEIDLKKVRQLVAQQENKTRNKKRIEPLIRQEQTEQDDRNYDIRDVLTKAKDERTEADEKYHSLKNTQYDILKNINLKKETEPIADEPGLKELIHTITNTSMLNKLGDNELSLDLLSEFQPSDNTLSDSNYIRNVLQAEKQKEHSKEEAELDRSFYTSSLNFGKDDFDDMDDFGISENKKDKKVKVLIIAICTLALLTLGIILFLIFKK